MKIMQNTTQNLVLTEAPWWAPVVGVLVAVFCFWAASQSDFPAMNRGLAILAGITFITVSTLAMRKIRIHFDREAGTVTRTTEALLPLAKIHLFRARSETRSLQPVLFAYLERQLNPSSRSHNHKPAYALALATGHIPEEVLSMKTAFIDGPQLDKVRWLVGFNAAMKHEPAQRVLNTVNQWLGTRIPLQNSPR